MSSISIDDNNVWTVFSLAGVKEALKSLKVAVSGQILLGDRGLCNLVVLGELASLVCLPLIIMLNFDSSVCQEIDH